MLATNASGSHVLRHGYTRDHVLEIRVVLDNGQAVTAGRLKRPIDPDSQDRLPQIARGVVQLLEQHADLLEICRPRTRFNRCGYLLDDIFARSSLDVPRLLVGSEGTLAHCLPKPPSHGAAAGRTVALLPGLRQSRRGTASCAAGLAEQAISL